MNKSEKGFFKSFFNLLNVVDNKKYLIYIAIVLASIVSIISLQGPNLIGKMTDVLASSIKITSNGIEYNIDFALLNKRAIYVLIIYLTVMTVTLFQSIVIGYIVSILTHKLRTRLDNKINKLPISYLDKHLDGDILSLMSNDITTISDSLFEILNQAFPAAITVIGTIIMMLTISFKLTLIVFVYIPIMGQILATIVSISQKYFKSLQENMAKLNSHVTEMYSNHDVIISYNGQTKTIEEFDKINESLFSTAIRAQFLSGLMFPIINILNNVSYVFTSLIGSKLIVKKSITIGGFQSFIQYLNGFQRPIGLIAQITTFMQQTKAASDRITKFLENEDMLDESNIEPFTQEVKGDIEFKNVVFSYNPEKKVINNISFKVNSGEKVAIVGHTGSGKTTIINLLMKFYNIDSGDILIDGTSIKNIKREDIADLFTLVLQDTWLFEDTIKENIKFGSNENVLEEDIVIASKNANVYHYIKTLPNGFDEMLNEELSNISVGQKQQLTIARAFLKNSKMLILDEATSSIDSRTEALVQNAMENLMENKTTFIIAHRLSTIKNVDKIIFLENGNIIEMGSPQELLEMKGKYYELYNAQ